MKKNLKKAFDVIFLLGGGVRLLFVCVFLFVLFFVKT